MSESLINWDDQLDVASLSDVGMRRTNNQDNFCVSLANSMQHYERKGHVFIVADGMGAHAAGELASKLAIDHIPHLYNKYNDASAPEELKRAVNNANAEIHRRGQANEEFHAMGTTCSVLTLLPQGAVIAHVGDSRVYRSAHNKLEQLTFDHSLVWEMKAAGQLTEEEEKAGKIPSNVITRSLGPYAECRVDLEGPFPVQVGDTFLLCSDGLMAVVPDVEIGAILANMPPKEAVRVLVDLSNLRGGPDNITVVVVKVTHPQMATNGNAAPLKINAKSAEKQIPVFLWGILVAALFFTLLFWFHDGWKAAVLPGVVAIATLLYAGWVLLGGTSGGQFVTHNKRFGKGPYTRIGSPVGPQFSQQLASILDQLQQGAKEQDWQIDWAELKKFIADAKAANQKKDHPRAIRSYGRAVSFLMDQLRNQTSGSSSSLDL